MALAFIMDPLSGVRIETDSSFVLMEEGHRRGLPIWHTSPDELRIEGNSLWAKVQEIQPKRPGVFEHIAWRDVDLGTAEIVFLRKDPPFNIDYVRTTYYLDAITHRTRVVNAPHGLREVQEKLWLLRWPQFAPTTLISRDMERIRAFLDQQGGKAVIKPWDGNGGRGIFILEAGDRNLASILETATQDGRSDIIVQEFLPQISEGDKRIILIDGQPSGAFLRIPPAHDHRGNMHVGARVEPCDLNPRDQEICGAIGPVLKELGQVFVGIDVIGQRLTEVNVTSPTGLQECNRFFGSQLEADLLDAAMGEPS